MTILTVGIDLAKNLLALLGVKEFGKAELVRWAVPREQLRAVMAALPPIGKEACSGTHHWARKLHSQG